MIVEEGVEVVPWPRKDLAKVVSFNQDNLNV